MGKIRIFWVLSYFSLFSQAGPVSGPISRAIFFLFRAGGPKPIFYQVGGFSRLSKKKRRKKMKKKENMKKKKNDEKKKIEIPRKGSPSCASNNTNLVNSKIIFWETVAVIFRN